MSDKTFPAQTILGPSDLKSNKFFEGFLEKEIAELLKVSTIHTFNPGDYVVREHETSEQLFIILSGRISIGKVLYAGDEKELSVLTAGDFFGEMAFLDDSPRSASASCVEETTVVMLNKQSFERLAQRRPAITYKMTMKIARALAQRLRSTNDLVENIFSNPNKAILELKTRLMKIQTMLMRK